MGGWKGVRMEGWKKGEGTKGSRGNKYLGEEGEEGEKGEQGMGTGELGAGCA